VLEPGTCRTTSSFLVADTAIPGITIAGLRQPEDVLAAGQEAVTIRRELAARA
jgi:hypothetical protein